MHNFPLGIAKEEILERESDDHVADIIFRRSEETLKGADVISSKIFPNPMYTLRVL